MLKYWEYLRVQVFSYFLKFGVVGVLALVVDVVIFNLISILFPNHVLFLGDPIGAKVISTIFATLFAWFGNRYWTFREHRRSDYLLELLEYSAVAGAGMLISIGCLWISHYVLGFQSLLADNISTNIIGFSIATAFRFLLYRYWVFGTHRKRGLHAEADTSVAAAAISLFEDETYVSAESAALESAFDVQNHASSVDTNSE